MKISALIPSCIFLVHTLCASVSIATLENEAQRDSILNDPASSTVTIAEFRAGDTSDNAGGSESSAGNHEVALGNSESYDFYGNVDWNLDGTNPFTLEYDAENGDIRLTVGTTVLIDQPTDWFNTLLFSIEAPAITSLEFTSADINGLSFGPLVANSGGGWAGVNIGFSENSPSSVNSFILSGNIDISTINSDVLGDEFRGEIFVLSTVPEPSTYSLTMSLLALLTAILRRR